MHIHIGYDEIVSAFSYIKEKVDQFANYFKTTDKYTRTKNKYIQHKQRFENWNKIIIHDRCQNELNHML